MYNRLEWDGLCQSLKDIFQSIYDCLLRGGLRLYKVEVLFDDGVELLFYPAEDLESEQPGRTK